MTGPVARLRTAVHDGEDAPSPDALDMWCPGCNALHTVGLHGPIGQRPPVAWDWDGNLEQPTLSPSILNAPACSAFVIEGQWRFLPDCAHDLAGQVAAMVPLPATAAG